MAKASLIEEWKKQDPLLEDFEGFLNFTDRVGRFEQLLSELTTWNESGGENGHFLIPKEIKKYRGIWAVFASRSKEDQRRFCRLFCQPVRDLKQFEEDQKWIEKHGDVFVCFEVMHEETLDYDPENPRVKGSFSKSSYYDLDWQPLTSKPDIITKIERHLRKVSEYYNQGAETKGEPYPTPPAWITKEEPECL